MNEICWLAAGFMLALLLFCIALAAIARKNRDSLGCFLLFGLLVLVIFCLLIAMGLGAIV